MRRSTGRGVSPIIATIMMVVITIMLSATVVVMVMSFNSSGGGTRYGSIALVEKNPNGQYTFYFGSFQPRTLFSQVKASIAGHLTENALSRYTAQNPYSYGSVVASMYPVDLGGEGAINAGDSMVILFDASMTGMVAEELIVFIDDGNVIAKTSVIVSGGSGPSSIDIGRATSYGSPPAGKAWPLILNAANQQGLMLPNNASFQPTRLGSITITTRFMLDLPPSLQQNWSSILDKNGDNGYRLQLSGPNNGNRWIEFGVGGNNAWVRSNGMRTFSQVNDLTSGNFNVVLKAGVWYTVVATYSVALGKVQLYVNNTAGVLQLAGEMPYATAFDVNTWPLYIGAYGINGPTRGWFDGTIQYITLKVT